MRLLKVALGAATLETYFPEPIEGVAATGSRPCLLVLPGGGYRHLSPREGEPMALRFCGEGMACAVLRYSVAPARYPQALVQAAAAMAWLRRHAAEHGIDASRIFVAGFSAGGHLAGCLGAFWGEPWLAEQAAALMGEPVGPHDLRPRGLVLGYPVITSGSFAHHGSFEALCGSDVELAEHLSLEGHVTDRWPATFVWHTADDQSVPVENSLLLAHALHEAGVPCELHVFPHAPHGSGLGTAMTAMDKCASADEPFGNAQVQPDVATWPTLALRWMQAH